MEPTKIRKERTTPPGIPAGVKPRATIYTKLGMARTWAKKSGHMSEEDYRNMLSDRYGVRSAKELTEPQREAVLAHFKTLGWEGDKPLSDSWQRAPLWLKARALWRALAAAGAVRVDTDEALLAYAKRQARIDHWRWLNARQCHMIIEALKKWADRVGIPTG